MESWKSRLPDITAGYTTCDIYNMDKSKIFFRALPDTFREKGTKCKGGKKLKDRISTMFCVSMDGEFEKILVIGKCGRLLCFKCIDIRALSGITGTLRKANSHFDPIHMGLGIAPPC